MGPTQRPQLGTGAAATASPVGLLEPDMGPADGVAPGDDMSWLVPQSLPWLDAEDTTRSA